MLQSSGQFLALEEICTSFIPLPYDQLLTLQIRSSYVIATYSAAYSLFFDRKMNLDFCSSIHMLIAASFTDWFHYFFSSKFHQVFFNNCAHNLTHLHFVYDCTTFVFLFSTGSLSSENQCKSRKASNNPDQILN